MTNSTLKIGNFGVSGDLIRLSTQFAEVDENNEIVSVNDGAYVHFDLNSDYDKSIRMVESVMASYKTYDSLTFDENIFDGDIIDDQLVESFITFATGLNSLNRQ